MAGFATNPIEYVANFVSELVSNSYSAIGSMLSSVAPFAQQAFLFLLIYTGLRLFFGYGDLKESLNSIWKIIFVVMLLYSASVGFQNFVVPGVHGTREFLSGAISSNTGGNLYASMDHFVIRGIQLADVAFNIFKFKDTSTYVFLLFAIGIIIVTVLLAVIMAFVMLGAEVILLLILAVGPFYIISFLYNSTRNFFFLWVSAVFANIILFTIGAFFIGLAVNATNKIIVDNNIEKKLSAIAKVRDINSKGLGHDVQRKIDHMIRLANNFLMIDRANALKSANCEEYHDYTDLSAGNEYNQHYIICSGIAYPYNKKMEQNAKKIRNQYKEELNNQKNQDGEELARQEAIAEEPIAPIIYLGLILLIAILIKVTFEIPSIAQTLSGGAGAGASTAALAYGTAQYLKARGIRAAIGSAKLGWGASKATARGGYNFFRTPPPSPLSTLNVTLTKLNENIEKQNNRLAEIDNLRKDATPAMSAWAGNPSHVKMDNYETNLVMANPHSDAWAKQIESKTASTTDNNPSANNPTSSARGEDTRTSPVENTSGNTPAPTPSSGDINTTGDANINRANIKVRDTENAGRNLPSNAANAASGAIESQRREEISNQTRTSPQEPPRSNDNNGKNK